MQISYLMDIVWRFSNKNGTVPWRCLYTKCLAFVIATSDGTVVRRGKDHVYSSSGVPGTSVKVVGHQLR